ncbi:MAG: hypothetical protein ACI4N3_03390 [Alphaproteobacteria bacterium]
MIFKNKEMKKRDNLLVNICDGCKDKENLCNCMMGNVYNIYTKNIYLKKEIRKAIEDGVVDGLSGREIITNIKKIVDNNSIIKKNIFTDGFTVHR